MNQGHKVKYVALNRETGFEGFGGTLLPKQELINL